MHVHFLDPYQPRRSPVHSLDGRIKLLLTLAFILSVALTPIGAWPVYILMFSLMLCVEVISDLGVRYVLKRSLLAFPFVLAALPVIFTASGAAAFELTIGPWALTVTQPGLERFLSIACKSWISVQAAVVLAASTPFPNLLAAMRAIHVPRLLVAIFSLMWRYLFVLADEALRLMRARAARSSHSENPALKAGGSLTWRAQVAGGMAGGLFLRSIERSDRIYMAMVARGYDGEVRALPSPGLRPAHWATLLSGLAVLAFLLAAGYLFWA
jgi:cobalt/nickel transport system permease protein